MEKKIMREHMLERFGKVFNYTMSPPMPGSLNIELNNSCNQKCVFCPFHGRYAVSELKPSKLTPEFVKQILDQAKKLGIGNKELGFYLAGEAFLYKELPEVIAYAKQIGYKYIFLTTNGVLATEDRLKEVIEAGLDSIRFSVNGGDKNTYKDIHGTDDFDNVLNNIRFLHEYRKEKGIDIAISLSCVLTKKTINTKADIVKVFSGYVDDIIFIPVMLSRLKKLKSLKDEYELEEDSGENDPNYVCPMLFDTMYINSFGKIVPCCDAYDGNVEFADLYRYFDLKKAWTNEAYRRYRSIFLENADDRGTICSVCTLRRKGAGRLFFGDK